MATARKKHRRFGREILDATKDLDVRVKPCDIKTAVCRDHQKCVLANAIKRITGASWCDVGPSTVFVGIGAKRGRRYKLNGLGRDVVRFFNENEGKAAPSSITLRAPRAARQLGARAGCKVGGKHKKPYKRCKPTR